MTNLVEIFKNAPKDVKLYSLVEGECSIGKVWDDNVNYPIGTSNCQYDKYGHYFDNQGECILFPSKDHRTWDNWQEVLMKEGDYVVTKDGEVGRIEQIEHPYTCIIATDNNGSIIFNVNMNIIYWASPEEKAQFLNAQTFRVGDIVTKYETSLNESIVGKILSIDDNSGQVKIQRKNGAIVFYQKEELKPALEEQSKEYEESIWFKEDFKPFDKVLVRDEDVYIWTPDFFSYIDKEFYICIGNGWKQCIPYNEETAHLVGTKIDCPTKYKTW